MAPGPVRCGWACTQVLLCGTIPRGIPDSSVERRIPSLGLEISHARAARLRAGHFIRREIYLLIRS